MSRVLLPLVLDASCSLRASVSSGRDFPLRVSRAKVEVPVLPLHYAPASSGTRASKAAVNSARRSQREQYHSNRGATW